LEVELAKLKAAQNPLPVDIRETVRQILKEELAVPSAPNLLTAVGSGLTEEQQVWLSNNQSKLAEFFQTMDGQAVTRRFYTLYKDFVCK
jgi:hypothetical protein